ncbi:MAG: phytanoyl-CoA dioxygenase family protein [Acidobacteriota bacterium]
MRPIFQSSDCDQTLRRKGWVRTPLLDSRQVTALRARIDELQPADGFAPGAEDPQRPTYHCTYLDPKVEYRRASDHLIREFFAAPLKELLADYRILTSNIHVKPPGQGALMIHQNWPTTAQLSDTTVTAWCPLIDVDETNGALQVIDGSHKLLPEVANFASTPYFHSFEAALKEKYFVPLETTAGEAVIFDDSLLHYSADNRTGQARVAIQIELVPRELTTVIHWLDPAQPERFEVLAADSDFYVEVGPALFAGRPDLPSLGFVDNRNRQIDEAEFAALLSRGQEIRATIYGA